MGDNTPKKTPKTDHLAPAWAKGQSGNPKGRPKGSKNALTEFFYKDMLKSWETGGIAVIADVMKNKPDVFLRVMASIIPKDYVISTDAEGITDEQARARITALAERLDRLGLLGDSANRGLSGRSGEKTIN